MTRTDSSSPVRATSSSDWLARSSSLRVRVSARLERAGFLVTAIRPPTVPPGTARLRFTFTSAHRDDDIDRLAAVLQAAELN